ncbi:MAG: aminotransferase class IV [Myxococcota bacterium]|nr:aminotransferase class IV [Myxococcota bacterium]
MSSQKQDPKDSFTLVNGEICGSRGVHVAPDDPGLILGMSVFETLRTYGGRLFRVDAHLKRLRGSLEQVGFPQVPPGLLLEELRQCVGVREGESMVRVTMTGGGLRVVHACPIPVLPAVFRCATLEWETPSWLPGKVKHTSRAYSRLAVSSMGVDEVIWSDRTGCFLEGTTSNVFAVKDGVLCTPPIDGRILPGVTRQVLLELARSQGMPVHVGPLSRDEPMDEFYLSSTLKEISPIVELNGEAAAGSGPLGERLLQLFGEFARGESARG